LEDEFELFEAAVTLMDHSVVELVPYHF